MYYALVENDNDTLDVVFDFDFSNEVRLTALKEALEQENGISAMKVESNLSSASFGAVWDGSSFSGANEDFLMPETNDDEHDLYVFLHNNKVIAGIRVLKNSARAELLSAAYATGIKLYKAPSGQALQVGNTVSWDGTKFSLV